MKLPHYQFFVVQLYRILSGLLVIAAFVAENWLSSALFIVSAVACALLAASRRDWKRP